MRSVVNRCACPGGEEGGVHRQSEHDRVSAGDGSGGREGGASALSSQSQRLGCSGSGQVGSSSCVFLSWWRVQQLSGGAAVQLVQRRLQQPAAAGLAATAAPPPPDPSLPNMDRPRAGARREWPCWRGGEGGRGARRAVRRTLFGPVGNTDPVR